MTSEMACTVTVLQLKLNDKQEGLLVQDPLSAYQCGSMGVPQVNELNRSQGGPKCPCAMRGSHGTIMGSGHMGHIKLPRIDRQTCLETTVKIILFS